MKFKVNFIPEIKRIHTLTLFIKCIHSEKESCHFITALSMHCRVGKSNHGNIGTTTE